MTTSDPDGEAAVPEELAHRILARAVEIESREGPSVPLARLREVAREAGIAPEALARAVQEALHPPRTWLGRTWDRFTSWFVNTSPASAVAAATTNILAFSAAWILMAVGSRVAVLLGDGWVISNGIMILTNVVGIGMAIRVRARLTAVLLAITAAAMLAEYPLHLIYGIGVLQGAATKWGLLLAAGFGIMLSRLLTRHTGASAGTNKPLAASTDSENLPARNSDPDLTTLRLRPLTGAARL
jgi:hypothetical protein